MNNFGRYIVDVEKILVKTFVFLVNLVVSSGFFVVFIPLVLVEPPGRSGERRQGED